MENMLNLLAITYTHNIYKNTHTQNLKLNNIKDKGCIHILMLNIA